MNPVPAILLLAVCAPAAGEVPSPAAARPEGRFVLDRAASDDVRASIERSIAGMSFLVRPIARGRLAKANPTCREVEIAYPAGDVSVRLDRQAPVRAPADGRKVRWRRGDGEVFDLTAHVAPGVLRQRFVGKDGERVNVFRTEGDGRTLRLEVTISSPRLPAPLSYTLVYRRTA